jgi:cellulose synthase/poly-beta-1,6-N-acetylglucosamine synthase-like glycosyltransferase
MLMKERVLKWWDYCAFVVLSAINLAAIGYFLLHWFSSRSWQAGSVITWLITLQIGYWLAIHQFRWFLILLMRTPTPMKARDGWRVGVATTFVPGLESFEMLEKTVNALVAMKYPHETWVLDEGDSEEVKALCRSLGVHHFTRKHLPQYQTASGSYQRRTKHGNYNAWFSEAGYANYDLITGFDPDHVPHPEFLDRVLGFFNDPQIGYVQTPQVYYNQGASFIARGAAEETYSYYSVTQMASYNLGFPIVTGCHHTHRVSALKEVGGFAAHDADDLLITLLYRASGWQGVYQPEILAKGLAPVDWEGYLRQQLRWAQSVLDVKFRAFPKLASRLPLHTRIISGLHGLFYIQDGISGFLSVCLLSFMLVSGVTLRFLTITTLANMAVMLAVLRLTDFYHQRFFLDARREWGFHWRAGLLRFGKWPYIFLGFLDAATNHKRPYTLTVKVKKASRHYMLFGPHLITVSTLTASWVIGIQLGKTLHPLLLAVVAFIIVMSISLMWTETWIFPEPFDRTLWSKEFCSPTQT